MKIEKRLERILSDLNKAAQFFEDREFDTQAGRLDKAAGHVEEVKYLIESLQEAA
jgi:hypothetical protein